MITLVKLYPKYGLQRMWKELENGRKNLYMDGVKPIFAFTVEGKGCICIMLDIKSLEAYQDEFLVKMNNIIALRKTETVPLMSPLFFPVREGVDYTLERYIANLEVAPEKYETVYNRILDTKFTNDTHARWMSFSLGKEDIILFMFSDDRESTNTFIHENIESIGGVKTLEIERIFDFMPILSTEAFRELKEPFMYSQPPGRNGTLVNPELHTHYIEENSPMISIVRLMPTGALKKLWTEIELDIERFSSNGIKPMYATHSEGKSHVSVIFELSNFEILKRFLVENVHTLKNVRQTRTVPLLESKYFPLPEGHPTDLERYLISIRADPKKLPEVRSKLETIGAPGILYQTFISYSLGEYDVFSSVLASSREAVQEYAQANFDNMDGIVFYNITSQQKVLPLASKEDRQAHKAKFS